MIAEHDEPYFGQGRVFCHKFPDGVKCDAGRLIDWKAVHAGAEGRKSDRANVMAEGEAQAVQVRIPKEPWFVRSSPSPDGADGVDDVTSFEVSRGGDYRLTGRAATQSCIDCLAFLQDLWSTGTMNGAIDAATAKQAWICCVNDCLGVLFGNVPADKRKEGVSDPYPGRRTSKRGVVRLGREIPWVHVYVCQPPSWGLR
jgi:hypothetical protein